MKKYMLLFALVLAVVGGGIASSVATANNGATTTQFKAAYTDPVFGPVTCSGVNVYKTAPNGGFNKDSEDCTILNGGFVGTYTLPGNIAGWLSDSSAPSASAGKLATSVTIVVTDNGDGTSNADIVAYY